MSAPSYAVPAEPYGGPNLPRVAGEDVQQPWRLGIAGHGPLPFWHWPPGQVWTGCPVLACVR